MTPAENPFTFGAMITDPAKFVGRRAELGQIIAKLNGSQPQGAAVVGPRRIGKSSLLHYLHRPRPDEPLRPGPGLHVVYFSAASGLCSAPERFRHALAQALLAGLPLDRRTGPGRSLHDIGQALAERPTCDWALVEGVLDDMKRLPQPKHPVVCLDEFEALLEQDAGFDDRFFNGLRSWANEGRVTWVTASARPLEALRTLHGLTSPFFNLLATVRLGELAAAEAEELLAQAGHSAHPFSAAEQRRVLELAGRNPYHLQVVAWRLWQMKAAGQVDDGELRRYLCDQPSPPAHCDQPDSPSDGKRKRRLHPAWLIAGALLVAVVILVALLAWQAPDFVRPIVGAGADAAKALWRWLQEVGDGLGGLFIVVGIAAALIVAFKRRSLGHFFQSIWDKFVK